VRIDGHYQRPIKILCCVKLLFIGDFGLALLDAQGSKDMLELVEERFGRTGLVVTSQSKFTANTRQAANRPASVEVISESPVAVVGIHRRRLVLPRTANLIRISKRM
jgi:hypothetical protein